MLVFLFCAGCATGVAETKPWPDGPDGGRVLETRHYRLHVTTRDGEFNRLLAESMERAARAYEKLAPTPDDAGAPKAEGYVFALRDQWADFTRETTGPASAVYLKIGRGGYAHGDSFATFFQGGPQTVRVARHEGWHQHVATRFDRRPPPFLEEGLATLLEFGFEEGDLDRPRTSQSRVRELRRAVNRRRAWPLEKLLTMHAGHVVGTDGRQIGTFYAQAWAFARFLAEEHTAGLQDLLAAYADGTAHGPHAAVFEKHLGLPLHKLSSEYESYVRRLTYLP